jgi:hypothetical protein
MVLAIQVGAYFRFPFTPVLVALACLFSLWNDNHALEIVRSASWDRRPDLVKALQQWRSQFANNAGPIPIIFVAAEGGASRAGYWTGDALGILEEKSDGQFSRHLFLISSISGSDVGTAAFVASLRDERPLFQNREFDAAINAFTGRDFLSPTLAGMLFPDLAQRFLFWPAFPDRASYLERSWEVGWTEHCHDGTFVCSNDEAMQAPFLQLWSRTGRWLPILIFGGAREEDGRRILTSNVAFIRCESVGSRSWRLRIVTLSWCGMRRRTGRRIDRSGNLRFARSGRVGWCAVLKQDKDREQRSAVQCVFGQTAIQHHRRRFTHRFDACRIKIAAVQNVTADCRRHRPARTHE